MSDRGIIAPLRLGRTRLSGGRHLGWAEWGPEDGVPVLLCPGAATGRSLGFGGGLIDELGVRLVSVDRPGLGASDPSPGRTFDGWASDVAQLADRRALSGMSIVGYSQGAPFALSCAAAGLARSVALVSGTDELAHPDLAGMLSPDVRKLVESVATDPAEAEAWFSRIDADVMWTMVVSMSGERDRAFFTQPAFEQAYRRALAEGFCQGPAGYARDTLLAMGEWPFDLSSITLPVDLWYGSLDTSPVHSPDHGETLARRLPTAHRHLLPDEGGALLWTRSDEIVRALLGRR